MDGIIVSIKYGNYVVLANDVFYNTSVKGLLKFKNKIYVGDKVSLTDELFIIDELYPRHSLLKRPQIANIDQMFLIFSLKEPDFSYYLAFKYLTYANFNNVKASIVLTKKDMSDDKEANEIVENFAKVGVSVYITSSKNNEGLSEIKELFKDKITVLVGQSGVGKSSLINAIDPNYAREIGEYSLALGRGKHQTKEVVLLPYEGGFIADTPGFSSLELDMSKLEIVMNFPGFNIEEKCFFNDCLHVSEKDCAIKKKVEEGNIPSIAYLSYIKLLEEGNK